MRLLPSEIRPCIRLLALFTLIVNTASAQETNGNSKTLHHRDLLPSTLDLIVYGAHGCPWNENPADVPTGKTLNYNGNFTTNYGGDRLTIRCFILSRALKPNEHLDLSREANGDPCGLFVMTISHKVVGQVETNLSEDKSVFANCAHLWKDG